MTESASGGPVLAAAFRRSGLSVRETWIRYLALGGNADEVSVAAQLHGLIDLPAGEYNVLAHALNEALDDLPGQLSIRDEIYRREEPIAALYSPVDAVFPLVALVDGERAVEVVTIGREGCAGLPAFLGSAVSPDDCFCQVSGAAWRLPIGELAGVLSGDGGLHEVLHRFTQATMVQLSQNVACNRLHSTEERCARWLLQTRDRVGSDSFDLTQEFLAQMLGVRRGTVSLVAGTLQQAGLIRYARGRITVLDGQRLHEVACECYDLVEEEHARLDVPTGE